MGATAPALRVLKGLEADVARCVEGRDGTVLAFSGGIGSLLVGALARKRCELRCAVVGTRGSADLEAAVVARGFLDYRLDVIGPTRAESLQVARQIRASDPGLALPDVLSLVPLAVVEAHYRGTRVVSGFGLTARTPALRQALATRAALSPGLGLRFPHSGRRPLIRMATAVGLPESFALAAPHAPVEGSGIGPVLREMARDRGVSVARLLSKEGGRVPERD